LLVLVSRLLSVNCCLEYPLVSSFGFLAPVFFASIGMRLDLSALEAIPEFLLLLIAAAVLGKLLGAGVPVFWMTRNWKKALVVGSSMNARGAAGLVIADIAMRQGLFSHPDPVPAIIVSLFSAIVIIAVITTLLTPIALRCVISNLHSKK
jgi:Kef-type K+ transport system membrane component KefB